MANLVTKTETLDDAGVWTLTSATVTANSQAAPAFAGANAGLADTVADNSAAAQGSIVGTYYNISADTNNYIGSVFVRKDAVATRWPDFFLQFVGGPVGFVNLNTSTGAIADGSTPAAEKGIVDWDATWWRLWLRVANNGSSTQVRVGLYPDHLDALGGAGQSAGTGSVVLWGFNITQASTLQPYVPDPFYAFPSLAAGDVTTQLRAYINTNAAGADVNPKLRAALATSLGVSAAGDLSTLLAKYIGR